MLGRSVYDFRRYDLNLERRRPEINKIHKSAASSNAEHPAAVQKPAALSGV